MEAWYFGLTVLVVGYLFIWSILVEQNPYKFLKSSPFAYRDSDEFAEKYGDKYPF